MLSSRTPFPEWLVFLKSRTFASIREDSSQFPTLDQALSLDSPLLDIIAASVSLFACSFSEEEAPDVDQFFLKKVSNASFVSLRFS